MTSQELIDAIHKAARDISYYNAAEGDNYFQEQPLRSRAQAALRSLKDEAEKRGLTVELNGYLL